MNTLTHIFENKIISIVRGAKPEDTLKIAKALRDGGVRLIEITLNSPNALESIELISQELGEEMVVGAGTVLDPETARAALLAGSKFILSPTVHLETIKMTKRYGAVSIPGAFTPTEILTAYENGGDIIKVFPASVGPNYFKDIRGPLSHIPLLPTGGVTLDNITEFQKAGVVGFGIGSSLVDAKQEVNEKYLTALTQKAKSFVSAIRS
ncbi:MULTISPECIES: bifunctional 4-hydroxy-2-oxoglutarate aldolase/2-dehydro-3-deoxy-phosphogluconate aldolase [Peribacillus]|jgi:2-dehydro-3-deoxyphosphogluconate aldolase / (4S)-4-hydroxy-2-oxoglutarate aldolase|uniref:bifunctional 4-hydroxy-2-oxoglutarate aldolase/2-dehydro-3-deoxy-phosphogluconate aldolase n=1 Tax=Peribacillus TaxID=2675229 RepID=UPI00201BC837|nr:bifunctional 4-hydroxy-2-oxoglutarate aldolase/2-dehydro-3-deoxy-phosphogluconate aldolase [Peribacillus frigoritolerans]MCD1162733.1 bifunctional 4-hydroxy-2-oxoglutarate aldolase/2-dehydro-3-deoxy-phosphogluconate aldolase [Peribacillus castrilensis]MEB2630978.1 bifunctional 4-hydroxy-2-oxoglutarate aldolase/2-dehydro-3-deoxy-phosphogluconate aldolase [Peribacillus frigoritolerans]MEE3955688.1 bifunctional 4-hydroxy-2-oxoglutarate aldolase/2-dehydro-3-deoxy-phosphogluconate aldolase [Periba